jgi:hypothetical protein
MVPGCMHQGILPQSRGRTVQNWRMDDIVKQALVKWPNVPDCYGWLGLDSRGRWYIRDEATQAQGPFPGHKGAPLQHAKWLAFIGRNYEKDAAGQWYFQNGPQRVYVELECTPWVCFLDPDGAVRTHTGCPVTVSRCLVDEGGRVYLETERGVGLVHSQDTGLVAQQIDQGAWVPESVMAADLESSFGFVRSPLGRRLQE